MTHLKILIVEDESLTAMALEMELEAAGYQVCALASTGKDAIALARRHRPDIVLMDLGLSGDLNGIDTAARICQDNPTPILFITGYPDQQLKQAALALKPIGYLIKPINCAMIKLAIDQDLENGACCQELSTDRSNVIQQ